MLIENIAIYIHERKVYVVDRETDKIKFIVDFNEQCFYHRVDDTPELLLEIAGAMEIDWNIFPSDDVLPSVLKQNDMLKEIDTIQIQFSTGVGFGLYKEGDDFYRIFSYEGIRIHQRKYNINIEHMKSLIKEVYDKDINIIGV